MCNRPSIWEDMWVCLRVGVGVFFFGGGVYMFALLAWVCWCGGDGLPQASARSRP